MVSVSGYFAFMILILEFIVNFYRMAYSLLEFFILLSLLLPLFLIFSLLVFLETSSYFLLRFWFFIMRFDFIILGSFVFSNSIFFTSLCNLYFYFVIPVVDSLHFLLCFIRFILKITC